MEAIYYSIVLQNLIWKNGKRKLVIRTTVPDREWEQAMKELEEINNTKKK